MDSSDTEEMTVLPRSVVLAACRAMAETATALESLAERDEVPVGMQAMLEGRAAVLDRAGIELAEQFIEERTARRLHPSNPAWSRRQQPPA